MVLLKKRTLVIPTLILKPLYVPLIYEEWCFNKASSLKVKLTGSLLLQYYTLTMNVITFIISHFQALGD